MLNADEHCCTKYLYEYTSVGTVRSTAYEVLRTRTSTSLHHTILGRNLEISAFSWTFHSVLVTRIEGNERECLVLRTARMYASQHTYESSMMERPRANWRTGTSTSTIMITLLHRCKTRTCIPAEYLVPGTGVILYCGARILQSTSTVIVQYLVGFDSVKGWSPP